MVFFNVMVIVFCKTAEHLIGKFSCPGNEIWVKKPRDSFSVTELYLVEINVLAWEADPLPGKQGLSLTLDILFHYNRRESSISLQKITNITAENHQFHIPSLSLTRLNEQVIHITSQTRQNAHK